MVRAATRLYNSVYPIMLLFSFGFTSTRRATRNEPQVTNEPVPSYISEQESRLEREEHATVSRAVVDEANPEGKRRKTRYR